MLLAAKAMLLILVALLAEGVDRNKIALTDPNNIMVALLAEGVDRNGLLVNRLVEPQRRPPRGGRG